MKSKKAFTLIEVIIVLTVISILSAVSVSSVKAYNRFLEKREINSIINFITKVRYKSILNRTETTLKIKTDKIIADYFSDMVKDEEYIYRQDIKHFNDTVVTIYSSGSGKMEHTLTFKGEYYSYDVTVFIATGYVRLKDERKNE